MSDDKKREAGAAPGKLHAFRCTRKDYMTHGIHEFPLWMRGLYVVIFFLIWAFAALRWRTRVEGEDELVEHVRGAGRGSVLVMNHVSMVEPVVVAVRLWRRGVVVRPIYKSEFDNLGPAKFFFPRVGAIPIERGQADLFALRAAKNAIERGECILLFPEGTRVRNDEQEVHIHGGFSMIAQMGKTDVVPMAIVGSADPYGTRPTRARRPVIAVGEAVTFDELGVKGRKAQMSEMERVAMERVYALRDDLRHRNPGLW